MKPLWTYMAARVAVFAATYAVLWLLSFWWIEWTEGKHLALLAAAMVVSSLVSVVVLRDQRQRLSANVIDRATQAHDAVNAAENDEQKR